jgi:predicted SAM-dependent methyltransferase
MWDRDHSVPLRCGDPLMGVLARLRRSVLHRGLGKTLLHLPRATLRPLMLAVRTRQSAARARDLGRTEEQLLLHLGSGTERLTGWVNVDLYFPAELCLDLTRPLPIPDACADAIYSQHFIEHIEKPATVRLIGECARVLKPGGWLRIATPDLGAHVKEYLDNVDTGAADALNAAMRAHDHIYLYDFATLAGIFAQAGLAEVQKAEPQVSRCSLLNGLESRLVNSERQAALNLIVEGRRPVTASDTSVTGPS